MLIFVIPILSPIKLLDLFLTQYLRISQYKLSDKNPTIMKVTSLLPFVALIASIAVSAHGVCIILISVDIQ